MTTQTEFLHRYAEFKKGTSNKFYEVLVEGSIVTFRWGRIGTAGQSKTEDCGDHYSACHSADQQFQTKLDKGYVEARVCSPLMALVSGLEEPEERRMNGLPPVKICIPSNWSMYTEAGNARMRKFAQKYNDKLNLIRASLRDLKPKQAAEQANTVLRSYVDEWRRIGKTVHCAEASETEVREIVADFFDRLRNSFGVPNYDLVRWGSLLTEEVIGG